MYRFVSFARALGGLREIAREVIGREPVPALRCVRCGTHWPSDFMAEWHTVRNGVGETAFCLTPDEHGTRRDADDRSVCGGSLTESHAHPSVIRVADTQQVW